MSRTITRFPPSPTGFLHIGGARTALFNWLFAKGRGGRFILRIEDTDKARSSREMTEEILEAMTWLGLDWDEGPYFQSRRFDLYNENIERLLAENKAYYCKCTPDEVQAMRDKAMTEGRKPKYDGTCREAGLGPGPDRVVRFKSPLAGKTVFEDLVKGHVAFDNAELDDLVIRRADGTPTYHLAVVSDDAAMGVTHILRGDDHLSNTPRQVLLLEALGAEIPKYGHVPMILGPDKKKLSKRHGATSVMEYKKMGYLPEALVNYLVRLGWAHGDQEIFSLDDLVKVFSIKGIGKSAAVFDPEKLLWLNAHYIKTGDAARLARLLAEHLERRGHADQDHEYLKAMVPLFQPRAQTLEEMADWAEPFVVADTDLVYDQKAVKKFLTEETRSHLTRIAERLEALPDFEQKTLETDMAAYLDEKDIKFKIVAQPLRVALTGRTFSPGIFEVMELLGKTRVLARLERVLSGSPTA